MFYRLLIALIVFEKMIVSGWAGCSYFQISHHRFFSSGPWAVARTNRCKLVRLKKIVRTGASRIPVGIGLPRGGAGTLFQWFCRRLNHGTSAVVSIPTLEVISGKKGEVERWDGVRGMHICPMWCPVNLISHPPLPHFFRMSDCVFSGFLHSNFIWEWISIRADCLIGSTFFVFSVSYVVSGDWTHPLLDFKAF